MPPSIPILGQIGSFSRTRVSVVVGGVLILSVIGAVVLRWDRIVTFADQIERSRAQSFMERGTQAWQEGDTATARLCFETAMAIDADHLDAALALGRLQLQQGNRAQGRAVFLATASRFPAQSGRIALVYHDSLIGCGWWEELASFGLEQLAGLGRPEPLWLNAALEGTRIRGSTQAELAGRIQGLALDPLTRSLVLAQTALNTGETTAARAQLGQIAGGQRLETAWIVARLWRRAGDATKARLALARTDAPIGPELRLVTDYWIMQDEPELQEKQFARVVARAFAPPTAPMLVPMLVNLTLEQGWGGNSALLLRELGRRRNTLGAQTISALWLLAVRNQDDATAASWLSSIREVIDNPPALKDLQPWNEKTFLLLASSLPLSRETLYALIFTLNPARDAAPMRP